ncbi:exosortase F system-associated protein [Aureibaculum sp. 2210JD6-5]|uniref:exosortase F system-associated membrane protein n=1 Tax=Aureibaculum sp. 2210JD6-5 TaxID=3103957 RepID=UPI002AADEC9C|nr:exosortase F system-associated protein [Aureibaculum sp. 2210JD6-5]MDY7395326.1 exosortase F system-associated protein [Aureibaculum sp. 2210JD6-5]
MSKTARWILVISLFVLLVLVRAFQNYLFYDPFINYFDNDYLAKPIPEYHTIGLFASLLLRYFINTVISLAIIYVIFRKKGLVRFSIKFYIAAFIFLSVVYFILLKMEMLDGYLLTFYVRRFLIHPVFVLILVPAFYYQQKLVRQTKKL